MVLKGISPLISPDLLRVLSAMGHGDEIVLADINFPTSATCKFGAHEIRADGHNIPDLLTGILRLFPLDTYVTSPAAVMQVVPDDVQKGIVIPVWEKYELIIIESEGMNVELEEVERFAFYNRAKSAYAIVATGETAPYGNLILKKGVVSHVSV
ncbi:PREDICTED: fucose mutarotase-like [Priapulus caudatus]|uniref:L-fucose mutarotase n=1 Tax=Priapulus caudatus TaxID=37621 RepID=A0ABM1E885_PRICU|nr:PREDICTED: fucose mutarotase-like [Priapulus caudatus]